MKTKKTTPVRPHGAGCRCDICLIWDAAAEPSTEGTPEWTDWIHCPGKVHPAVPAQAAQPDSCPLCHMPMSRHRTYYDGVECPQVLAQVDGFYCGGNEAGVRDICTIQCMACSRINKPPNHPVAQVDAGKCDDWNDRYRTMPTVKCQCGQHDIPAGFDGIEWYWQHHRREECTLVLPNSVCWCGLKRSEHITGHADAAVAQTELPPIPDDMKLEQLWQKIQEDMKKGYLACPSEVFAIIEGHRERIASLTQRLQEKEAGINVWRNRYEIMLHQRDKLQDAILLAEPKLTALQVSHDRQTKLLLRIWTQEELDGILANAEKLRGPTESEQK